MAKPKTVKERLAAARKAAVPKAGPKRRRSKAELDEARRRAAITENTRPIQRAVRKSGRVRRYEYTPAKNGRKNEAAVRIAFNLDESFAPIMREPQPLSPEAEWMEDMPEGVTPWDWLHLMPGYPAQVQRILDATTERTGPMRNFTPLQRQIVAELFYRGPLSQQELADALRMTLNSVRSSMRYMAGAYWIEEEDGWLLTGFVAEAFTTTTRGD